MPGLLDRERIIAAAGFNRWLVPPAALCIHLCIGMAYGFSVFWLPLSRAIGLTAPKSCPDMSIVTELFTTTCDWKVASLGAGCTPSSSCFSDYPLRCSADGSNAPARAKPASPRARQGEAGAAQLWLGRCVGTATHLAGAYFAAQTDIKIVHVPYTVSSNIISDMLSGAIQASFDPLAFVLSFLQNGSLRALAVGADEPVTDPIKIPNRNFTTRRLPLCHLVRYSGAGQNAQASAADAG